MRKKSTIAFNIMLGRMHYLDRIIPSVSRTARCYFSQSRFFAFCFVTDLSVSFVIKSMSLIFYYFTSKKRKPFFGLSNEEEIFAWVFRSVSKDLDKVPQTIRCFLKPQVPPFEHCSEGHCSSSGFS